MMFFYCFVCKHWHYFVINSFKKKAHFFKEYLYTYTIISICVSIRIALVFKQLAMFVYIFLR